MTVTGLRRHLSNIMDCVKRGERIRVFRHGKAIAGTVPADVHDASPAWKRPGLGLVMKGGVAHEGDSGGKAVFALNVFLEKEDT